MDRHRLLSSKMAVGVVLSFVLHAVGVGVLSFLRYSPDVIRPPAASVDPGEHSIRVTLVRARESPIEFQPQITAPPAPIFLPPAIAHREMLAALDTAALESRPVHESRVKIENPLASAFSLTAPLPPVPAGALTSLDLRLPDQHFDSPRTGQTPAQRDDTGISMRAQIMGDISPTYPPLSRRHGEHGLVVLEVRVLATGIVDDVRVLSDPGYPRLVVAAIDAVRSVTFTPAMRHERPVASWLEIPVRFELRSSSGRAR